ncbi:MAG: hypothetical protein IEMM0003_0283 [bacterium]|nr:MAG: hypothetical protein IEMM0003_0283 [bacterium]
MIDDQMRKIMVKQETFKGIRVLDITGYGIIL